MKRIGIVILAAALVSGCVSTSGPKFELAQDDASKRELHMRLAADTALRFNMLGEYPFSRPKEVVVTSAKFSKPFVLLVGSLLEGKAIYCLMIETQNPAVEGFLGRASRTFSVEILQQTDDPSKLRASITTKTRQPGGSCTVRDDAVDVPQLIGHRYTR